MLHVNVRFFSGKPEKTEENPARERWALNVIGKTGTVLLCTALLLMEFFFRGPKFFYIKVRL